MIDNGLLIEAKKIYETNIRTKAVLTPIGYKELFPYFENKDTLEHALELIKQRSRRYAKRQYTWFNNQMNINWFNTNYEDFNKTVEEIKKFIGGNI
jgi:tRNA dimethylallyltransferase